jgi:hypothetical protein
MDVQLTLSLLASQLFDCAAKLLAEHLLQLKSKTVGARYALIDHLLL